MIEVKNLTVELDGKVILDNISTTIADGDKYAILGPSGEGKSVLVRTILGLIKPKKGIVIMDGIDVHKATPDELNKMRKKIGFLFQGSALFDFMNVEENISFPLVANENLEQEEMDKRVNESLKKVGLEGVNYKMPDELSGGMQKRVALARAIINKPKYIFYDEPTSGLDPVRSQVINYLIGDLTDSLGLTSLTITHDMSSLNSVSNKILFISRKKIAYDGPTSKMMQNKQMVDFTKGTGY